MYGGLQTYIHTKRQECTYCKILGVRTVGKVKFYVLPHDFLVKGEGFGLLF
jgi:hypothetical protein